MSFCQLEKWHNHYIRLKYHLKIALNLNVFLRIEIIQKKFNHEWIRKKDTNYNFSLARIWQILKV